MNDMSRQPGIAYRRFAWPMEHTSLDGDFLADGKA